MALQTFLGGNYINDFNLFGRTFRVTAEAEPSARTLPDAVSTLYVRTAAGDMVPLSSLVTIKPTRGPAYIERYNVYRAVTINGSAAAGYSQGDAITVMESLAKALPDNLTYYWTGSVFQQKRAGEPGAVRFCHGAGVRVPGARRAVRELDRAVRGDSCIPVRRLRRLSGLSCAAWPMISMRRSDW